MWSYTIITRAVGGFHEEKISNKMKFGTVTQSFVLNHQKSPHVFELKSTQNS